MKMKKITIGIIGYGKLGSVLAEAVSKKFKLFWITDNGQIQTDSIFKKFQRKTSINHKISEIISVPDIIILSVNDSNIEYVAKNLSIFLKDKLKDVWVVHCSGVLPLSILSSCEKFGAKTACIHPFQTFYFPDVSILKGIGWTIETKHKPEFLKSFIKLIGGKSYLLQNVKKNTKVLHHLSAVFASNFLSTVISGAGTLERIAGMKPEEFLPHIIDTTIRNNLKSMSETLRFPLTGPIARGDIETIKLHLESLRNHSNLLNTYIYLSLATLETAKKSKLITKQKFAEIKEILLTSLIE
ncbi:MAG: DUF2520 domain-containing protein [Bacteroidetes bacterium]|nr:MAG: DUF2520 domain-containing protein [Bacteroidota bacterium]